MSGAADQPRAWLGSGEDWGLSPARLSEIGAELDDHLHCQQADEGLPAAQRAGTELKKAASRRKLAAPHLTDQVYATLNRWPTKREWRELIFLLCCFAAILLSDWLALRMSQLFEEHTYMWAKAPPPAGLGMHISATATWLLQALARAAFFAGFAYALWRACRLGWGVLLARILQLKLIHTVLVVTALLLLGEGLWQDYFAGFGYMVPWPPWLSAPLILAVFLLIGMSIVLLTKGRYWAVGLFAILMGFFLYAGGPLVVHEISITRPIVSETRKLEDGSSVVVPSSDQAAITKSALSIAEIWPDWELDVAGNQMTYCEWRIDPLFGVWTDRGCFYSAGRNANPQGLRAGQPTGKLAMTGPVVAAGGGIGWLAVPIPLLGLIGLIGLVAIMGRRGPAEFAAYSTICVLAIIATILPFVFDRTPDEIFELSALGVMQSPLPAFEDLLTYYTLDWSWLTLVGGLVLSAGVPWLLTGLFLRPGRSTLPPVDAQVAE